MADLCMCGHEEREHLDGGMCLADRDEILLDDGDVAELGCACLCYRRSPLSAFRGPAVSFTREEAAGWLRALARHTGFVGLAATYSAAAWRVESARWIGPSDWSVYARNFARRAGRMRDMPRECAIAYLAARILRAVRP